MVKAYVHIISSNISGEISETQLNKILPGNMCKIDKYNKSIAKVPLYLFIFFIVFTFWYFSDMSIPLLLRLEKYYLKNT